MTNPSAPQPSAAQPPMANRWLRLMRLDKPIGTYLLLWPTLWALWFASGGQPSAANSDNFLPWGDRYARRGLCDQ